ncbi:hypothetical protein MJO29_016295 [Puccinia striiformis f. sp. tritici]|nr:hypothetical protein MJO29_016295 [Puccinia striiformis f. sp. tritici]
MGEEASLMSTGSRSSDWGTRRCLLRLSTLASLSQSASVDVGLVLDRNLFQSEIMLLSEVCLSIAVQEAASVKSLQVSRLAQVLSSPIEVSSEAAVCRTVIFLDSFISD